MSPETSSEFTPSSLYKLCRSNGLQWFPFQMEIVTALPSRLNMDSPSHVLDGKLNKTSSHQQFSPMTVADGMGLPREGEILESQHLTVWKNCEAINIISQPSQTERAEFYE